MSEYGKGESERGRRAARAAQQDEREERAHVGLETNTEQEPAQEVITPKPCAVFKLLGPNQGSETKIWEERGNTKFGGKEDHCTALSVVRHSRGCISPQFPPHQPQPPQKEGDVANRRRAGQRSPRNAFCGVQQRELVLTSRLEGRQGPRGFADQSAFCSKKNGPHFVCLSWFTNSRSYCLTMDGTFPNQRPKVLWILRGARFS